MRDAARTATVGVPALVVVALAWLRLEQPVGSLWRVVALLALALAASAPRRVWLRAVAALGATAAAAWLAVGIDLVPWRLDRPGSAFGLGEAFSALGTRFGNGFTDFYGTHLPFDPRIHAAMHELVLSGVFVFALAVALLVAARKPVAATLALMAGAGWPSTLLGSSHGLAMGAAILGAALVVLAGLGSRRVPTLALPAAAVVATAAVAVGSSTAAGQGLVRWQAWNLAHVATGPADVGFVWNAQYGGLRWTGRPTTVLQVVSDQPPSYLRATVLDDFVSDHWAVGMPRGADSLEPPAAYRARNQTPELVTATGLEDDHLVGGSIPMRFEAAAGAPLVRIEPGFAALDQNLPRGFRYTVWTFAARPTAGELRRSPPEYPPQLRNDGMFDVGRGVSMPAFGTPRRAAAEEALLSANPDLNPYVPLARLASDVTRGARTPYEAVEKLQEWFDASGTFHYSNHPTEISPALVGFVTKTHTGYCQYFAGAMALMLRYLGIPARVAVGFAGGQYDPSRHLWNITDREAHAWVEVWFKGYGWLPFDPTPAGPGAPPRGPAAAGLPPGPGGRGQAAGRAGPAGSTRGASTFEQKLKTSNGFGPHLRRRSSSSPAHAAGGGGARGRAVLLLLAALAAAAGAVVATKIGFRLTRTVRRDPRSVAAACRLELTSFLVDQRIEAPRSATLGELGELVRHEFGVRPEAFVAAATAARFGPAEDAAAAAATARKELRALLEGARRGLTLGERLRGLLSLRSLTWRPPSVEATASAGTGG
ncbi:MAG TPA: transglutaminase-like domain-containing protein [Gaiellaceae bacterium]|nr:transglutaminase-like domain-containing protein [Gaiellaceae bacterium]